MKGITVTLYEKVQTGTDGFNRPVYEKKAVNVENVLAAPASEQEVLDTLNLTGRKAIYTLAIPKWDTHDWENREVEFFGRRWKTIGMPIEGIDALIPLQWNKKVRVENYGSENKDRTES